MYKLGVPLSENEHAEWLKFKKKERYISLAQMVRTCVRDKMNNDTKSPFEKQLEAIKIMFGSLVERNEKLREWMEFLDMRFDAKNGKPELVYAAGREIIRIVLHEESDLSSIIKIVKKYDRETIIAAIIDLRKYGILDSYRKREEKNETDK
jgi:hypothetical protein